MNSPQRSVHNDDHLFLIRGLKYIETAENLRSALANIVRSAVQAVGSNSGSLYLLRQSSGSLEPYVLVNFPEEYLKGCSSVPLGTQCCGRAALHKVPWIVSDMWEDPLFKDCREAAMESGIRAAFSIPVLIANGECIGSLAAHYRSIHEPTQSELERLRLFAQLLSVAIATERDRSKTKIDDEWLSAELTKGPTLFNAS
jgi:GAF domain-containing protein